MRCCLITYTRNTRRHALSVIECLAITAIVLCLIAVFCLPSIRSRPRGPHDRLVCGSNLKGIGTSIKIYANDHGEAWPSPAFDESLVGQIKYTVPVGSGRGTVESPNRSQESQGGVGGARELSTTRAFWMLVRSGDVTVNQFVCPNSRDENDPTTNIDEYYDFTSYANISYGYQVPFGCPKSRAREGADNRMIIAADKGPFYLSDVPPNWNIGVKGNLISLNDSPKAWRPFNSPNHGGRGKGEGQNCLYFDGHVAFNRIPAVGVAGDNIYTIAADHEPWEARMHGEFPGVQSAPPLEPIMNVPLESRRADSVIFP